MTAPAAAATAAARFCLALDRSREGDPFYFASSAMRLS